MTVGVGRRLLSAVLLYWVVGCGAGDSAPDAAGTSSIDLRSYRLGSIGAFAEMVDAGVKKLALSAPMSPEEMHALVEEAERIVEQHGVELYLERDFLVTDLFSAELTDGKEVLVICSASTLQEYFHLKATKEELVSSGAYEGEARVEIARRFGTLLSYSDEKIAELLGSGGPGGTG
jgi:hypothetical protein